MRLSEKLFVSIKAKCIKLKDLSGYVGIRPMNFSSFLYSKRPLPYDKLEKACNAIGIGMMACGEFFSGEDFLRRSFIYFLEQNGMSVRDVARDTGINISSLYLYKNGKRPLSNKNIETIMSRYGLELKDEEEL